MPLTVETASNVQRTAGNLAAARQALSFGTPETATEEGLIVQTENYLKVKQEHQDACEKADEEIKEETP